MTINIKHGMDMIFIEILQLNCYAVPELPPSRNPLHNCMYVGFMYGFIYVCIYVISAIAGTDILDYS